MSTSEMTLTEMTGSLTGFDEIAIQSLMGFNISAAAENPTMLTRAAVFVDLRRNGTADHAARKAVMEMVLEDVMDYFAAPPTDEIDPDDPDTDAGKDSTQPAKQPATKPRSATRQASSPASTST